MKKATRERFRAIEHYLSAEGRAARDALDSDTKLRAEVRDLKARLRAARERIDDLYDPEIGEGTRGEMHDPLLDVLRVLNLSNKHWRKGGGR